MKKSDTLFRVLLLFFFLNVSFYSCQKEQTIDHANQMLEGLASTGQTEISEFVQTCLYHIRKVNSQNQQGDLNYFYNQYGFPLIHYISVLKNENDHVICIKIPIARNDGQVLHYFQAIRYGDEFGYFLIGTESNIADEIDENQDFPEVLSIETEEDDDFDGSGGGSSSNFESSGCIKIVPLTTPICREEPCPNNCTPCRHPRINCAKRDDDGNSGGGGTGGGGSSSGTIVITIWSDRGTFNWGGKGGPPPNNPSYGGGNTNGSADTKCIFKREEIEEAFVSYFNTNYPDLQIPNNHVSWYVDEGCLRQVCEDYFDTGIKDFNNCFEDAIRKMYRLTEEEWEEFKEILENGFNIDKNPIYRLNICELDLLINFPECAIEVYKAIEKATIMTIYKWGQSSVKDSSDAFRHAYWMA